MCGTTVALYTKLAKILVVEKKVMTRLGLVKPMVTAAGMLALSRAAPSNTTKV
jgi:hypothetical protein